MGAGGICKAERHSLGVNILGDGGICEAERHSLGVNILGDGGICEGSVIVRILKDLVPKQSSF